MGFSAERARLALAMTENGRDIEAAIEYLVQNDEAEDQLPSSRRNQGTRERGQEERRPYRDDSDPALEDRRRRNQGRGQSQQQQQELSRAQQLQQQKDKFVGTASVFGMSVLSKANEFYKQGRDKVQSVMEDMTAEEPRSTAARRHQWVEDEFKPSRSQYKDSDSEEDEVYRGRREQQRQQEQRQQQQQRQQRQQQQQQHPSRPRQEKEAFEDTYVSSSRRGGAAASRSQPPLFSMDDSPNKQKPSKSTPTFSSGSKPSTPSNASRVTRAPSPLPPKPARPPRTLVQASSQQLAESNHYKEKGNEVFKLGQFGQAAEFYARAGQSLPSGHILLIVTQNNRAAALLKIGEYRETVSVCDKTVLHVQGPDGQGVQDILPESAGVNLKDQMGKALMRRATAYENLEKYKEARDDWAKLKELDPGHRNATEGQRRCEKAIVMVNGGGVDGISQPTARKPAVSAARQGGMSMSSPMQDMFASQQRTNNDAKVKAELARSEGVSKLRQNAAQQERDEDEKLRLTDQVEMKMTMWKAGKEDNIRALISSLGSVLWEGVGWKPVGLHELVTPSQVKIKYMRAIGKMHPDKVHGSVSLLLVLPSRYYVF
jgi:tetratricopeptide (TPR) repeat protein